LLCVRRRWNAARYRRSHGVRFDTAPQILELGEAFAGGQYFMTGNGRWKKSRRAAPATPISVQQSPAVPTERIREPEL
jgi:hypothetical protein